MPSRLRLQTSFEPFTAEQTQSHYVRSPPAKKQKMSLTQTYYIAASARSKLGREASRPDHDLRLLVGHANLLDSLMIELADAEREQEAWFNQTVKKAQKAEESRHIQWADTIVEEAMEDEYDDSASDTSDSSTDSEFDEEDFQMIAPLRRVPSSPVQVTTVEIDEDEDEEEYFDEEDDDEHALTRTHSAPQSPPELIADEFSDDETPPTSPPQPSMDFSEEQRQAISTTSFYDKSIQEAALLKDGYFIPERQSPLIAGY